MAVDIFEVTVSIAVGKIVEPSVELFAETVGPGVSIRRKLNGVLQPTPARGRRHVSNTGILVFLLLFYEMVS